MADVTKAALAQKAYSDLCAHLTACGWNYERHDERKFVTLTMRGDIGPIELIFAVSEDPEIITLVSLIKPTPPKEKRAEIGMAVNMANYDVISGSFQYNAYDMNLQWISSLPYCDSVLTKKQVEFLVNLSCSVIDRYSAWFMMLGKGLITLKQFYDFSKSSR